MRVAYSGVGTESQWVAGPNKGVRHAAWKL